MYPEKKAYQIAIIKATVIKTIIEDIKSKAEAEKITEREANKLAKLFVKTAEDYLDKLPISKLIPKEFKDKKEFKDHILSLIREVRKEILKKDKK